MNSLSQLQAGLEDRLEIMYKKPELIYQNPPWPGVDTDEARRIKEEHQSMESAWLLVKGKAGITMSKFISQITPASERI